MRHVFLMLRAFSNTPPSPLLPPVPLPRARQSKAAQSSATFLLRSTAHLHPPARESPLHSLPLAFASPVHPQSCRRFQSQSRALPSTTDNMTAPARSVLR